MKRVKRIELSSSAWKAEVLPLNYTRMVIICVPHQRLQSIYTYTFKKSTLLNEIVIATCYEQYIP